MAAESAAPHGAVKRRARHHERAGRPMIGRPASTHAALTIQERRMTYPDSKRVDVVEAPFGVPVADPYRWLEKDARRDPEVRGGRCSRSG
jgi:hypothetical protein